MTKLKKPITIETAFDTYQLTEVLGEGGAGRVYGGTGSGGEAIAVKLLTSARSDTRKRFKNEINFLFRNKHLNIVSVIDFGQAAQEKFNGPFYVMERYKRCLRSGMRSNQLDSKQLTIFSQVLDGVEAAHLHKVVHRDLKPENILMREDGSVAIADFGIARFHEASLATVIQTSDQSRLANFQYAAPEQRIHGRQVGVASDIYALGLILNELFTGEVPHGTDYKRIADVEDALGFLDNVVALMIKQNPVDRPGSINDVKSLIAFHRADAVSRQKLSELSQTVVPEGEVDDPLALEPPILINANYDGGTLTLTLDRDVNPAWVRALHDMGSYRSVTGYPPAAFNFKGNKVTLSARPHDAQGIVDCLKEWLPIATRRYHQKLMAEIRAEQHMREKQLIAARKREEENLRVNGSLKI